MGVTENITQTEPKLSKEAENEILLKAHENALIQQTLMHAGQRKINLIWEVTQAFVAIIVVLSNVVVMIISAIQSANGKLVHVSDSLISAMFLIIGFYFSRTNHTAIGGVGRKSDDVRQEYRGR